MFSLDEPFFGHKRTLLRPVLRVGRVVDRRIPVRRGDARVDGLEALLELQLEACMTGEEAGAAMEEVALGRVVGERSEAERKVKGTRA